MKKPQFKHPQHLIPVVVQDDSTQEVLMLAYTNQITWALTQEEGRAVFFSRSRNQIWRKGETSGHWLMVKSWKIDCDGDTILLRVNPSGPVCHLGTRTCFDEQETGSPEKMEQFSFLHELWACIEARSHVSSTKSYTRALLEGSTSRAAQKVGEEGVEVALAAVKGDREELKEESADLLYHLLVLWKKSGLYPEEIMEVLRKRHQTASNE